jgi:hypothetical protein
MGHIDRGALLTGSLLLAPGDDRGRIVQRKCARRLKFMKLLPIKRVQSTSRPSLTAMFVNNTHELMNQ